MTTPSSQDVRMQQSNIIYSVGCKDNSNKHCRLQGWWQHAYLMSHCKECQQQMMVDCNKGAHAKQEPTKLYVALQEWATIAEWEHHWRNDHVLCRVARGYNAGNNGWSQQVHEILQASKNPFHQFGSTTSTIANSWNASNKIDRDAMTQCRQRDNHSLLSIHKEQQQ